MLSDDPLAAPLCLQTDNLSLLAAKLHRAQSMHTGDHESDAVNVTAVLPEAKHVSREAVVQQAAIQEEGRTGGATGLHESSSHCCILQLQDLQMPLWKLLKSCVKLIYM